MWKLILLALLTFSLSAFAADDLPEDCNELKTSYKSIKRSCKGKKGSDKKSCLEPYKKMKKKFKACKKAKKGKGSSSKHAKKCKKYLKKISKENIDALSLNCDDPKASAKLIKKAARCQKRLEKAQKKGGAKDLTLKDVFNTSTKKCDKKKLKGRSNSKLAKKCSKYVSNVSAFYKEAYKIDDEYCKEADKTKVKNLKAIAKCSKKNGQGPYTEATGAKFVIQDNNGKYKCKKSKGAKKGGNKGFYKKIFGGFKKKSRKKILKGLSSSWK